MSVRMSPFSPSRDVWGTERNIDSEPGLKLEIMSTLIELLFQRLRLVNHGVWATPNVSVKCDVIQ